jgi:DNA repair exonuclease SbcCD ATPase subunit
MADIHIKKSDLRHHIHRQVFQKTYERLRIEKPDRICIIGDLYHDFVNLSPEAETLMGEFLNTLASIAPVIITRGNHDLQKYNLRKMDVVEAITTLINNPNVTYYNKPGFYEDENIIWVVHHHRGGDNPWKDIPHRRKKNKIYIDLYHDPIQGCLGDNGLPLHNNKYMLEELLGDYNFLGDIHLRQSWREGKTRYCGSILQNSFGESVDGKGFLIWNIEDKDNFTVEEVDIPNDYNYINLRIGKNYNYENIDLESDKITSFSEIKIKWHDYTANVNFENEMKIRQYIKDKWNIDKVKFDRDQISTNIKDVEMVNESINVLDPSEQRKIFIDFLEKNNFDDKYIKSVMDIDKIVNDRLNTEENLGITWSIDKLWFNNFRSYGDGNLLELKEMGNNQLIKIGGINQQGKSTIMDAISWVLYGKTMNTTRREKNSDNRYFNNKRDKNIVDGGIVIDINGQKYTILREITRKWTKNGENIASTNTVVEYFMGDNVIDDNKLNDEQKKDTQNLIDTVIGSFLDFVRLSVVTADNLNDLLSMERSIFIDSLIKDAGFDIFDKKLTEFKEFRKEIQEKRKNIDIEFVKSEIERIENETTKKTNELNHMISVIDELDETRKLQVKIKEEKIKQLDKIDDELKDLDLDDIQDDIEEQNELIEENKLKLEEIENLKKLIKDYDSTILSEKEEKLSELTESINNAKLGQSEYQNKIERNKNEIKLIGIDIDNIINNYSSELKSKNKDLDMDIMKIKETFRDTVNDYLSEANQKFSEIAEKQSKIHNEIDNLMDDGKNLKNENKKLESSSTCITCKRPLDDVDMVVIHEKISENKNKMAEIIEKVNELKPNHEELTNQILKLKNKISSIKDKDYSFDTELLNTYNISKENIKIIKQQIEENDKLLDIIKNNNVPNDLKNSLQPYYKKKSDLSLLIDDLEDELSNITKDLDIKKEELESLKGEISKLKEEKEEIESKKEIISTEIKVSMDIERSKNTIKELDNKIAKYNETLVKIESNSKIQEEIDEVDNLITELDTEISEKINEKMNHHSTLKLYESTLNQYKEDVITYDAHKRQDEVMTTYMKCVHRDGLPTFLLKKSIHIINQELAKILMDVDFTVYFDDELNLKMSADNRLDVAQNAIESSGMERTFTAVALKIALRKVNNKSKPNFILLDEIMGKLVDESVETFIKLLDNIKEDVDKLVIIEHVHPINYDVLIEVEKDVEGISTLNIEY